jgi:hypothetical protein
VETDADARRTHGHLAVDRRDMMVVGTVGCRLLFLGQASNVACWK